MTKLIGKIFWDKDKGEAVIIWSPNLQKNNINPSYLKNSLVDDINKKIPGVLNG